MSKVIFLPRLQPLVDSLRNSAYLDRLSRNPHEQTIKHGVPIIREKLCEFYGRQCGYLTESEQKIVQKAVDELYILFPNLPRTDIVYVAIHEESILEFGNTSFTVNNVVFLHPSATENVEVIQHETIHVLQREFPRVFDHLYKSLNYRRATDQELAQVRSIVARCNQRIVDNPDESFYSKNVYLDPQRRAVGYNESLEKVIVDLPQTRCYLSKNETESLWGTKVPKDSMSEMFATFLTKDVPQHSRQKINDLLGSISN